MCVGQSSSVLNRFCGAARLSLEGDLAQLRGRTFAGSSPEETACLRRNTIAPRQDFIVIPLTNEVLSTLQPLLPQLGLRHRVLQVQIEEGGELVFGAYDQFTSVWISATFGASSLALLREQGVRPANYPLFP